MSTERLETMVVSYRGQDWKICNTVLVQNVCLRHQRDRKTVSIDKTEFGCRESLKLAVDQT